MRKIDKIIIHCSATPEGRAVTVEEIRKWHTSPPNNWNDIGYHYIITLDGKIHSGRPIATAGAHTVGHNANSIGICYVGGTDSAGKPKDTRNDLQKSAMAQLIHQLESQFPNATVHGHNEFANKACPSFNVKKEFAV